VEVAVDLQQEITQVVAAQVLQYSVILGHINLQR
jgi:hypothetical protein